MERDTHATFSYASDGPVVTIDPIAANSCKRFLPFCEALVEHLEATVGGLKCAFNQSIGVPPRAMGRAVRANPGARDFLKRREQCDPEGRFLNAFWEEVLEGVGEGIERVYNRSVRLNSKASTKTRPTHSGIGNSEATSTFSEPTALPSARETPISAADTVSSSAATLSFRLATQTRLVGRSAAAFSWRARLPVAFVSASPTLTVPLARSANDGRPLDCSLPPASSTTDLIILRRQTLLCMRLQRLDRLRYTTLLQSGTLTTPSHL